MGVLCIFSIFCYRGCYGLWKATVWGGGGWWRVQKLYIEKIPLGLAWFPKKISGIFHVNWRRRGEKETGFVTIEDFCPPPDFCPYSYWSRALLPECWLVESLHCHCFSAEMPRMHQPPALDWGLAPWSRIAWVTASPSAVRRKITWKLFLMI